MKKLMFAACAVAFAAVAQAATVDWVTNGTLINGDTEDWEAEGNIFAQNGWAVYLFNNADVARADIFLASGALDMTKLDSAMTTVYMQAGDFDGAFEAFNLDMAGASGATVSGYAVIFDATTAGAATKAFVTDTYSAVVGSTGSANITVTNYAPGSDWEGLLNATSYPDTNWVNVPEPTSGLLLLLGMGALALKRKRA